MKYEHFSFIKFFPSPHCHGRLWPTHPPISSEIKQQGREAEHFLATSAEVKKAWIYTSSSP
jgi:hypothetical protein